MSARIFVFLFALTAMQGNAQTFLGKRAVISGTVLNGSRNYFSGLRAEYMLSSRYSLAAGFAFMKFKAVPTYSTTSVNELIINGSDADLEAFLPSDQVNFLLTDTYSFSEGNSSGLQSDLNQAARLTIQPRMLSLTLKKYKNGPFNAPFGAYSYLGFQYGTHTVSGALAVPVLYSDSFSYINTFSSSQSRYISGVSAKIRVVGAELGWGKNWFLNEWLNLDLAFGFTGAVISDLTDSALEKYMAIAYWRQASGNVYLFRRRMHELATSYPSGDMLKTSGMNLGVAFRLSLGIAL